MKSLADTLTQILKASGVNTKEYEFKTITTNFKPFLEQAKNQNADSYVFLGYSETAKAMKQARELGILARFYAGSFLLDPSFRAEAKDALEGTFFVYFGSEEGNESQAKNFLKSFKQSYRRLPVIQWTTMQAYDAANILIASIKTAYSVEGNLEDNLREALLQVENYPGVSGNLTMQKNGSIKGIKPALYIYKNKKIIKATAPNNAVE